jgi:hypothetical protein
MTGVDVLGGFALRFLLRFALPFAVRFISRSPRLSCFPLARAAFRGSAFFDISICMGNLS